VLLAQLRACDPDAFRVCRTLLTLIEQSAQKWLSTDRVHLARLLTAAGRAMELATRKERS
jgi:hypothetical protein